MSAGAGIPWGQAYELAEQVSVALTPYVERLKCVGSVRRRRKRVGDIEFLAVPHFDEDLVGHRTPNLGHLRRELLEMGEWVKGGERMMQIRHLFGVENLALDIYLAHPPASFGSLLAIRTGPAKLGQFCVTRMRDFGYRHQDGHAVEIESGERVPTDTEEEFFALADVPCVPPHERDALTKRLLREGAWMT